MTRCCARCQSPLARQQVRYCSRACYEAAVARPVRRCITCDRPFKAKARSRGHQKYDQRQTACSKACRLSVTRSLLLWVLRANRDQWLSLSDLAIWVWCDNSRSAQRAAKERICDLTRSGYVFERRSVIPDHYGSWTRVYRLVAEPVRVSTAG